MLPILVINGRELQKLINAATYSLPNESCALLLGKEVDNKIIVKEVVILSNSDESISSFSIDPQDLFVSYRRAHKLGLEVIGIFHSHPSLPFPSSKDKKFMRINTIVWLVYSTLNEEYKAYLYQKGLKEIQLHIVRE